MKKIIALFLAGAILVTFTACGGNDSGIESEPAEQNAPQFWSVQTTSTSVTVGAFAVGDGTGKFVFSRTESETIKPEVWYTSNIFGNLTPNTTYYIWGVQLGDEDFKDSDCAVISITTKDVQQETSKIAQGNVSISLQEVTSNSVTVQGHISDMPISVNNFVYAYSTNSDWQTLPDSTWGSNGKFTDLQPLTPYYFFVHKPGDDCHYDSNVGVANIVTLE
jgi:predicted small lipoprotein YifL